MIIFDVNVFVYALDPESAFHDRALAALEEGLNGGEPVGLVETTLVSTARIVTHRRLMRRPLSPDQALQFCASLRDAPRSVRLDSTTDSWSRFATLVTNLGLRGPDLSDAWLAAVAKAHRARFVTFDRGFRRFPGLDVEVLDA